MCQKQGLNETHDKLGVCKLTLAESLNRISA